jgi:hypothetical protein
MKIKIKINSEEEVEINYKVSSKNGFLELFIQIITINNKSFELIYS